MGFKYWPTYCITRHNGRFLLSQNSFYALNFVRTAPNCMEDSGRFLFHLCFENYVKLLKSLVKGRLVKVASFFFSQTGVGKAIAFIPRKLLQHLCYCGLQHGTGQPSLPFLLSHQAAVAPIVVDKVVGGTQVQSAEEISATSQ